METDETKARIEFEEAEETEGVIADNNISWIHAVPDDLRRIDDELSAITERIARIERRVFSHREPPGFK